MCNIFDLLHCLANWNYDDDDCQCGPQKWPGQIHGKQQSPIDLRLSKMKVITLKDPIQFVNYDKPISGDFVNTGHSGMLNTCFKNE